MEIGSIEGLALHSGIPAEELLRFIRRREQETGIDLVVSDEAGAERVHVERVRHACRDLWQGGHQPAAVADVRRIERRIEALEQFIRNRLPTPGQGRSGAL